MKALFCLLSICLCCSCPLYAQLSLQDSLVAWYPFDGDALDYSGNGNHGIVSGANLNSDRLGNTGKAYFFNGSSDFISLSNQQKFKPDFPITISAWVKIDDYGNQVIFNNDFSPGVHRGFWLNIVNGNLYVSYGNGGPAALSGRQSFGGTTLLQLGQWYHVAGIVRGMNDMALFVNGKRECGTYTGVGGQLAQTSNPGISGRGTNTASYFHGSIDEIRFYNRALDKSEVRILADFPPQDTTLCQGDIYQLDAGYGSLISWNPNSNLSCTNCSTPVASPIQNTIYTAITENTAACPDTVDISIITKTCPTAGPCDSLTFALAFSTQVNGVDLTIIDQSTIPQNAQLDVRLGDGNSIRLSPGDTITYSYTTGGVYTLCLEAVLALGETVVCSDTLCDTVEIISTAIESTTFAQSVLVYPNPTSKYLKLVFPAPPGQNTTIKLFNMQGILVQAWKLENQQGHQLDLAPLPKAYYHLNISGSTTFWGSQLILLR